MICSLYSNPRRIVKKKKKTLGKGTNKIFTLEILIYCSAPSVCSLKDLDLTPSCVYDLNRHMQLMWTVLLVSAEVTEMERQHIQPPLSIFPSCFHMFSLDTLQTHLVFHACLDPEPWQGLQICGWGHVLYVWMNKDGMMSWTLATFRKNSRHLRFVLFTTNTLACGSVCNWR